MKKIEYREGPEAGENFKKLAIALFQVPKDGRRKLKKRQPKKATSRKSHGSDKD
jgi:hypothetical protein